jgi:hypothetical protein
MYYSVNYNIACDLENDMVARVDITGNVYERLTVLEYIGDTKYRCQCSCGTVKDFYTQNLKRGLSKSCGCFNSDAVRARFAGSIRRNITNSIARRTGRT